MSWNKMKIYREIGKFCMEKYIFTYVIIKQPTKDYIVFLLETKQTTMQFKAVK